MKIRRWIVLGAVFAFVLGFGINAAVASEKEAADWMFHDIVDIGFVKPLVMVPPAENVMIIDARPKRAKYDKGHIPGAVSIPDSEFDKKIDTLPADKNMLLLYYCEGLKCKLSHNSAKKAEALGYTNVKVFAEGFPRWIQEPGHYAEVSGQWVKSQLEANSGMVLIDSRPKRSKYDKGHIPGAISISDTEFDKHVSLLPADKNAPLVFYCGGTKCKLSHKSAQKAIALGYKDVRVFSGGYPEWVAMVGKGEATTAQKGVSPLKAGKEEGSIDSGEFKKLVQENPDSVYLIDVRDADEFARGSFKTAKNIPVDKLEAQIQSLPTDKPIIFVCGTGARSGESYYMVKDLRPDISKNVYYLEAELTVHKDGSFEIKEMAN